MQSTGWLKKRPIERCLRVRGRLSTGWLKIKLMGREEDRPLVSGRSSKYKILERRREKVHGVIEEGGEARSREEVYL